MSKEDRIIKIGLVICALLIAFMVYMFLYALVTPVQADGGSIEFDGRVIDLRGASTVTIESQHVTTDWDDVTVTTSIVTVTVWSKP